MSTEQQADEQGPSTESIDDSFSGQQLRRGLVLLVAFIGMRAILWGPFWSQPTLDEPIQFGALILVSVLVGSVGLVYLGFTRWVDVDIVAWWIDRDHVRRDLLWGIVGFILALLVMLGITLSLQSTFGPPQDAPVAEAPSLVGTLLLYAFGFAVAAFQEETLFRGFLQTAIGHRFGEWPAVVVQAGVFSLAHVGYYPLTAWYLFLTAFAGGLVYGWLRKRRGRLLAPGIAHGQIG